MRFLVTNDDGIFAPGLAAAVEVLQHFGKVAVVAPDGERSAASHSITLRKPLKAERMTIFGGNVPAYAIVGGTPADCVKLALGVLFEEKPDCVVSGINAGANIGRDIHYSGTIGGAREGTLSGIPGVAISLDRTDAAEPDFGAAKGLFYTALSSLRKEEALEGLLNINLPAIPESVCPGIAEAVPDFSLDRYRHMTADQPEGGVLYWLRDRQAWLEPSRPDSDFHLLREGYITVSKIGLAAGHDEEQITPIGGVRK
ncbi:MAG: 5'/3'-nucleotidase SurE [Bhargavaea sp.]